MIKTITAVIQFLRLWAACQAMVLALAVRDKAFPPVVVPMPNFFTASAARKGAAFFGVTIFVAINGRSYEEVRRTTLHEFRHCWQFWHHPIWYFRWLRPELKHHPENALEVDAREFSASRGSHGRPSVFSPEYHEAVLEKVRKAARQ